MAINQLNKYVWLVETIHRARKRGGITLKEIQSRWLTSTPLTVSATRRILRGEEGTFLTFAIAVCRLISFSLSAISLFLFPIISDQLSDFTSCCYLHGL